MKKVFTSVLVILVIVAGVTGCKKIIDSIFQGIDVDVPEFVLTIPAPPPLPPGFPVPPGEQSLGSLSQNFNLDSAVKAQTAGQFGAGDVSSVKIKQMIFTIANADDANNFSNFESARISVASNASQNTPEVDIAAITFPQTYTPTYTYTSSENAAELRAYLNGSRLTFNVYGKLRRYTTKAVTISVKVTMKVK
jgi:hypothetical protein